MYVGKHITREEKRRRQRIRANITGLVILTGALVAGALLGAGTAYSITEPQELAKAAFRPVVVRTEAQGPELVSIGTFTAYAYCPCETCCGQWSGGPTASGMTPEEGAAPSPPTGTCSRRGRGPRTGPGHVKHMWCIRCRAVTEHRQEE